MTKPRPYIAQFRVGYTAISDVHAEKTAEYLEARLEEVLDEDDTVRVTQVVCMGEPLVKEETLNRLRLARNELCRLEYRDAMNFAQQLDMVIWKLIKRASDDDPLPNDYDYNRIVEIMHSLQRGENPLY